MRLALKILVNALAVIITAYLLPGVHIDGMMTALIVAIVLALLNTFLKPLLILLTLPITILTLGIFLLVINAIIILLVSHFVSGFVVNGFWWALLFSVVLSIINAIFESSDRYYQRKNQ
jgi:putative membrane protein